MRSQLRQTLRQRRRSLTPLQQHLAANKLCRRLTNSPQFKRARTLALYFASDGEISPAQVLNAAQRLGKHCFAPVVDGQQLRFRLCTGNTRYRNNRFGIPEPIQGSPEIAPQHLDLVLMPLVGFDRIGNRLGMGGGFYDRTFAFKARKPSHRPLLIGLAHNIQEVARIESQNWDIPLAAVVTDRTWITTKR